MSNQNDELNIKVNSTNHVWPFVVELLTKDWLLTCPWPLIAWLFLLNYSSTPITSCHKISNVLKIRTGSNCMLIIFRFWPISDLAWPWRSNKTQVHICGLWPISRPTNESCTMHRLRGVAFTKLRHTHTHIRQQDCIGSWCLWHPNQKAV